MDRNNTNDRTTAGVIAATAIIASIALLALAGLGGVSCAAEGENAGGSEGEIAGAAVSATSVTDSINYQGRLADSSGSPLTGTYTMTFGLYDVSTGGTALATDIYDVVVTDGLFNTGIDFDQSYFDGRELWLGVTVGTDDEMTPRQEFRPVPYALSLVPGANIIGAAQWNLNVETTHPSGGALRGQASATSGFNYGVVGASRSPDGCGGYFYNDEGGVGVHAHTLGDYSRGVVVSTDGVYSSGVYAHTLGDNSDGVRVCATGDDSEGVHASSTNSYGVYGIGKYGGHFTTNQGGTWWDDKTAGVNATTTHDYSDGVRAETTGDESDGVHAETTGDGSEGVYARTTGSYSEGVYVCTTGDNSDGVRVCATGNDSEGVHASSTNSYGVYGEGKYGGYFTTNQGGTSWDDRTAGVNATTTYDYSDGVRAVTTGEWSDGVRASTTGNYSEGVYASTIGDNSYGVLAWTTGDNSDGVYADTIGGCSDGVSASTTGYGSRGVYAYTIGDYSDGVHAYTTGDDSKGVRAWTTGDYSDGVRASTTGDCSEGVSVYTNGSYSEGVSVYTDGEGSTGVSAYTEGDYSYGVCAYSDKSHAIYADTGYGTYGVITPDKMCAHLGYDTGCADVAEYFPTPEDPEPGTVMTIDPAGGSKLMSSTKAYDTTVAGIVSTAPGVSLGTKEDGNNGEKLIAVAGRVPCKVDASYAAIKPGDLLTTSDTQGHAMKATNPVIGTILGKALEPLDAGTGTIEVLVTLQ